MVLSLAIVVLLFLLVAFVYQIISTPVAAVDAPTLLKSTAIPAPPAAAPPDRPRPAHTYPARRGGQPGRTAGAAAPPVRPAPQTPVREASGRLRSGGLAALAIGGLAAGILGGWLFHRTAGAAACSHQVVQVCSQGSVVLTSSQLYGGAIAVAGILVIVVAGVLAAR